MGTSAKEYREREAGLDRSLGSFHQAMIALGGAVGVGLFLGSAATIGLAGPAVLLTHVIASLLAGILGLALAEMAVLYPVAGSFGVYAERYLSPFAGFAMRLTYWFAHTLAIGAQMTAVGVYFAHWFPAVPALVWILGASTIVVVVNAVQVRSFANLESWFSIIKVGAIIAFVLVGTGLLAGLLRSEAGTPLGLANLVDHGGFFPNGWRGVWLPLSLMVTNFITVEGVAVTAGEAERPERTVPRALLSITLGLFLLYGLALMVMLSVTPWTVLGETGGSLSGSPFVRLFDRVGIPFASDIMNAVVISAALTSVTALLYLCARMLFSLSRSGHVPRSLGKLDGRGVPLRALFASTGGMMVAVLLSSRAQAVFLPIFGTAVAAMLSLWIVIFVCHLRFRAELTEEALASLPVRLPGHPWPSLLAITILIAAIAGTAFVPGLRYTFPYFLIWLAALGVAHQWRRSRG